MDADSAPGKVLRIAGVPALLALLAMCSSSEVVADPRAPPDPPSFIEPKPVTDPAEIGAWLRQMVGKFRVQGEAQIVYAPPPDFTRQYPCFDGSGRPTDYCQGIKGKGDCIAVGKGPGVQCMFNVKWVDIYEVVQPKPSEGGEVNSDPVGVFSLPGGVSYLDPAMALYGLDPGVPGLSYLLVDSKGLPEGGPGHIRGNRATFKTACVNAPALFNEMKPAPRGREEGPPRDCERIIRIDAKPDARIVHLAIEIVINGEPWTRHELRLYRDQEVVGDRLSGQAPPATPGLPAPPAVRQR